MHTHHSVLTDELYYETIRGYCYVAFCSAMSCQWRVEVFDAWIFEKFNIFLLVNTKNKNYMTQ